MTPSTSAFYSTDLSPEDARSAAAAGASLLLLDVPRGTVVGIDHRSFVVGPKFKGVKMIPPGGAHFVSTNAAAGGATGDASLGPTSFFFFLAEPASVVVRRWSAEHEVLVPLDDEEEEERYAAGVGNFDFDSGLAPYDLASWPLWRSLTRFVTGETIRRIAPRSEKAAAMSVVAEADEVERRKGEGGGRPTEAERRLDEQLERGRREGAASSSAPPPRAVAPDVVGAPRYARLPRHAVDAAVGGGVGVDGDDRGRLLTAANLDKTSTLASVVGSPGSPFRGDARELLGEFQHAFVSFWAGHSLLAFSAWRDVVRLAFSCDSGPCLPSPSSSSGSKRGDEIGKEIDGEWFRALVEALSSQLEVATTQSCSPPSSPLVDDLLRDSFLRRSARRFLEGVREAAEGGAGVEGVGEAAVGRGGVEGVDGSEATRPPPSRPLPAPSPELLASCARLSRVLEERLGWAGLGKPRVRELGTGDGGGGGDESDDSDGPVVVDLEKGY